MQERKVVVFSEDEWKTQRYRRVTLYKADAVLVKLEGAEYLYRVVKSRHTGNAGRVVRMEVL